MGLNLPRWDRPLLVHSSFKSLGLAGITPSDVVRALREAAPAVLFPTLTGRVTDGQDCLPEFDARSTPCWTGAIPEAARQMADVKRSLHPTHSVVGFGVCDDLIRHHLESPSPCGGPSPYGRLADANGLILMLGVTLDANTSFHHCEEVAGVPYVLQTDCLEVPLIDAEGKSRTWSGRLHDWGYPRRYEALTQALEREGAISRLTIAAAECLLIDAALQRTIVLDWLRHDPTVMLESDTEWMP